MPSEHGWTIETSREDMLGRIAAQEKLFDAKIGSLEKATQVALAASDKRFEGINEFRGALSDNQRSLMPRIESEKMNDQVNEKLGTLAKAGENREGRSSGSRDMLGFIVGILGLAVAIIAMFLRK